MGDIEVQAGAADSSLARALVYRFLARCFSYPDMELVKLFELDSMAECLEGWRVLGTDVSEEMAGITGWFESVGSESALNALQIEYTRLFINAFPHIPTPPYSSVYLDDKRTVWGDSTAEAAMLYEAAGLAMNEDFHDIPDHISAELEFASYLIAEQQQQMESDPDNARKLLDIQRKFLTEHLSRWTPAFFSRVAECSRLPFYSEMSRLAQGFIAADAGRTAA